MNANIAVAEAMGAFAYTRGIVAPSRDPDFMAMIEGRMPGDARTRLEAAAWRRGYIAAGGEVERAMGTYVSTST